MFRYDRMKVCFTLCAWQVDVVAPVRYEAHDLRVILQGSFAHLSLNTVIEYVSGENLESVIEIGAGCVSN